MTAEDRASFVQAARTALDILVEEGSDEEVLYVLEIMLTMVHAMQRDVRAGMLPAALDDYQAGALPFDGRPFPAE